MKNFSYYTLSLSGGKDSLALFLKILDEGVRLNEVVTVDLGDEYQATYDVLLYTASICLKEGIKFTVLSIQETEEYRKYREIAEDDLSMFEFMAFAHEKRNGCRGYGWCGKQRWGTAIKRQLLNGYYQSLERFVIEYVGIAADEVQRIDIKPHKNYAKAYPLIKWKMTEADCLEYCYQHGVHWIQSGIRLYDILDRVSCQHCQQKNLKELRNIRRYLPELWDSFKGWQDKVSIPYRSDRSTIYDLDKRFSSENVQLSLFDMGEESE
ncbi:MAG: phosphoadenosine phosphosulfate reductase [Lachnospiraceae bacterium]|jgi:tRNA(Ile)-lysidine synthase TilS/MesJ|nr:phosphoadenosine phosphosulfate reductase [Lachnospiraceae bacterium]